MVTARYARTALVVDDSAGARRRIQTLLRLGGWRVHQAVGMEAALGAAAVLDLDLVVTDMTMRGGNGPALLRRLRDGGCRAHFLAVSSRVTAQVRARAAAADAAACLAKPIDPRLLVDFLRGLAPEAIAPRPVGRPGTAGDPPAMHVAAERVDGLRELYLPALPRGSRALPGPAPGRR
jgi:CheY-like chemotaxis protein